MRPVSGNLHALDENAASLNHGLEIPTDEYSNDKDSTVVGESASKRSRRPNGAASASAARSSFVSEIEYQGCSNASEGRKEVAAYRPNPVSASVLKGSPG